MFKELTESIAILDQITIVISAGSMLFSVLVWIKLRKQKAFDSQRIQIKIIVPGTEKYIALWSRPERKHLTRAEVLGLIGSIPRKSSANYKIAFLNTRDFFQRLAEVQDNKDSSILFIECSEQELQQFDLAKVKQQCEYAGW